MGIKQILFIFSVVLMNTLLLGSEGLLNIVYRKAIEQDALKILSLIDQHLPEDEKKIYILPEKFRLDDIEFSIKKGDLFVACNEKDDTILGYKRIFLIEDEKTHNAILEEMGYSPDNHIDTAYFTNADKFTTRTMTASNSQVFDKKSTHIYLDMDLTHPDYRGRGINHQLAIVGFCSIQNKVIEHINKNQSERLIFSYGLSGLNDYNLDINDKKDIYKSRTPGIARSFAAFVATIKEIINKEDSTDITIDHNRYKTGLPLYDKKSTKKEPLPQEKWVPSSGNFFSVFLK